MNAPDGPSLPAGTPSGAFRLLLAGALAVCLLLGIAPLAGAPCPSCIGLVSVALPWAGALVYALLLALAYRRPESRWISHLIGIYGFFHASLLTESVLLGRWCWGCLAAALLAFSAAIVRILRFRSEAVELLLSLALGVVAGFFLPVERLDDALTRQIWPSKVLSRAPSFVDSRELTACEHASKVRLLVYEEKRSCKSCSVISREFIPGLSAKFPEHLCIHRHALEQPAPGHRLPLFVLVSTRTRLLVIEGIPKLQDLEARVSAFIEDAREGGPAPSK